MSTSRPYRSLLVTSGALAALALVVIAVLTLPAAALLGCVGLGAVVGWSAGVGAWLVLDDVHRGAWFGAIAAGVAAASVMALGGLVVVLGAATVVVIPVLYVLAALFWWLLREPSVRATPGRCSP